MGRRSLILGSLSSDVFERHKSTGSEPFSLLISLDATVFVLPSVLILIETICPKICSKLRLKSAKSQFPVDVRRSKTSLLKLPILVLVLVVFSLDKEILKWLSICPKYSRKLPKSFFYDRKKIQKQKHRPKMRKMFSFLFEWLKKTKFKERNYRLGSLIQVESGKVDLSECTKLSIDERLDAPDPDMLGYRTFVVI